MIPIYWLLLFVLALPVGYVAFKFLHGAPRLTIVEIRRYLRPAEADQFLQELDPITDEVLRRTFTRRSFLQSRRDALHRMKERLVCISHDALIFTYLANTELWLETKERAGMEDAARYIAAAQELQSAAVELRFFTLVTLARIEFWLVLRTKWWFPYASPRISDLGSFGGISFSRSYQKFRSAAGALCMEYGQEFYDDIMPLL